MAVKEMHPPIFAAVLVRLQVVALYFQFHVVTYNYAKKENKMINGMRKMMKISYFRSELMSPVQVSEPEDPNRTSSVPTASESSFLSESSSLSLTRLLLLSVPVPPPPLVVEATTTEGEDWKPSDKADRSYKTPLNPRPKAPLLTNEFD